MTWKTGTAGQKIHPSLCCMCIHVHMQCVSGCVHIHVHVQYKCMCVHVSVHMFICEWERERGRERDRSNESVSCVTLRWSLAFLSENYM